MPSIHTETLPVRRHSSILPAFDWKAIFTMTGDGYLDIYFVNGAEMPSLLKRGPQYRNRRFHNNGNSPSAT
jgi:hypothetical protein